MSRQFFKIFSLTLLAVFVVLGTTAGQKGGGDSGSKDIPMKAIFSDGFKITSDDSSIPYVNQGNKPGMNYVVIGSPNTSGHFVMAIYANTGRYVNMLFDNLLIEPEEPLPGGCGYPYFLYPPYSRSDLVATTYFFLRTFWKCQYIPHVEPDGTTWTEFIRSTTSKDATILNLTKMVMGETVGVSFEMARFRVNDDQQTPGYDESQDLYGLTSYPTGAGYLLVTATDWDGNGVMDWILRTISGKLVVVAHDRTDVLPQGDCFRLTSGWPCECGSFGLPFELRIARK
jgi:hypothetical protein